MGTLHDDHHHHSPRHDTLRMRDRILQMKPLTRSHDERQMHASDWVVMGQAARHCALQARTNHNRALPARAITLDPRR
ncbi:hypothetical protein N7492_004061 [Penicillium capsulatum]|uniref:Uncharacterized protein n=1 Tax=Penicillium capsulatum TaxID=69766 RepID=A0A9W9LWP2_9EURO|nr:hypothetical protein N7492_004061 [Penicillium capsulatum]KAJ6121366.1 hypothetical protein N7512_003831 [Penicillium capsulatum]